jgi:hypothetical protein
MHILTRNEFINLRRCKTTDKINVGDLIVRVEDGSSEITLGGVYRVKNADSVDIDNVAVTAVSEGARLYTSDGWMLTKFAHYEVIDMDEPI